MTLIAILMGTLAAGIGSVWLAAFLSFGVLARYTQHMLSLAAGALLATAFIHLLPEAFESQASARDLFAILLLGLVFFFLLDKAELWHHGHEHHDTGDRGHAHAHRATVGHGHRRGDVAGQLDSGHGVGAAGIEMLSRGAGRVTFLERDGGAARVVAFNLARTHLGGERARVVRADAILWLRGPDAATAGPFDIVVVDPPYADTALLADALAAVEPHLAPGARVVAKHFWRDLPPARVGLLASDRERRFGDTTLTFYRYQEDR